MIDHIHTLTILADITAEDVTGAAVQIFVNFFVAIAMFVVLFLPLLMIPYIFLKLGSVSGKMQSKFNSMGKSAAKKGIGMADEKSGFKDARALRKRSQAATRQRRMLEGKNAGGAYLNAMGYADKKKGRFRTAGQKQAHEDLEQLILQEREKIHGQRVNDLARNSSYGVMKGVGDGKTLAQMRAEQAAGTGYTAAEDAAALDYHEKTNPSATVLSHAAVKVLGDTDDLGNAQTMQNLANLVKAEGGGDYELAQLSKAIRDKAGETKRKDLGYGEIKDGTYVQYVTKQPLGVVDSGLGGINKDSIDDAQLQQAIRTKIANTYVKNPDGTFTVTGNKTPEQTSAARVEIIQQTLHIDAAPTIDKLATNLNISTDLLKEARRSLKSNGTIDMPTGI